MQRRATGISVDRRLALGAMAAGLAGRRLTFGNPVNDTIRLGAIGVGGRFRHLQKSFAKIPQLKLIAVCDVRDDNLATATKLAEPGAQATRDYRAILDRKDIDAVVIASPDHWHVPLTIAACQAGKDVYVEKPLTHDRSEGDAVITAQNDHRRIVQVGMQQRSMPQFQEGYEIVRSGRLGKIHKVRLSWNRNQPRGQRRPPNYDPKTVDWKAFVGNARPQPFDAFRMLEWRWTWDFGGGILTDLMVHFMDIVNWYCDLDAPTTAVTVGDNFQTKGLWETPDTISTLLQYPEKQLQVYFEGTFVNARTAAMVEFMGTEGTLYLDRGRYELHPERGQGKYAERVIGQGKRGADFYDQPDGEYLHLKNWVDCVVSRKPPLCPAEAGVRAVKAAHLGNQAYREGKVAKW